MRWARLILVVAVLGAVVGLSTVPADEGCGPGCGKPHQEQVERKRTETEMKFLARYERLRTQAPGLAPGGGRDEAFSRCMQRGIEAATRRLGPPRSDRGPQVMASRMHAISERVLHRCQRLLPADVQVGYGRGAAAANATGSPVEVIIN